MLCLNCKNETFVVKTIPTPQTFRGEEFTVEAPAMVCTKCNWATMTDAQADGLAKITGDEYRRRHGLLTSAEIVALRKQRNMSQRAFAEFLGVGEASVKRWETGSVQEKLYDERMRAKCMPATCCASQVEFGVAPTQIRFHTFTVQKATVFPSRSQINAVCCAGPNAGPTSMSVKIELSDGHSWRASHYVANDPALATTA